MNESNCFGKYLPFVLISINFFYDKILRILKLIKSSIRYQKTAFIHSNQGQYFET